MQKKPFLLVFSTLVVFILSFNIAAYSYEEPKYKVLESEKNIEIRQYNECVVAEVCVDGDKKKGLEEGFHLLANYIYGNNRRRIKAPIIKAKSPPSVDTTDESLYRSESIPMTAPVTACSTKSTYTLDTLPSPDNKRVKLVQLKSEKFAVLKFSGSSSKKYFDKKAVELQKYLDSNKLEATSPETDAYFNPPWIPPFLRRNEVMFSIAQK
jgi:hypothetical protein